MHKKTISSLTAQADCPCGSQSNYENCCKQIHIAHEKAITPEMLMRARYSAFVKGRRDFLLSSWDHQTRPENLNINPDTIWIGLKILDFEKISSGTQEATVTFETSFIEQEKYFVLKEISLFRKSSDLWFYVSGDTKLNQTKLYGKSLCPCGSGKKFKRCCMKTN